MMMAAVMIVTAAMIMTGPADHAVDRTHRAADTRADRTADDATDRPRRPVAAIGSLFSTTDDALRMPGQRRGEQH